MKTGDQVKIVANISNHGVPIGTIVFVINITDDDYKVWYGGKFHWVTDDDIKALKND